MGGSPTADTRLLRGVKMYKCFAALNVPVFSQLFI